MYNLSLGVVKMFYPPFGTKQVEIFLFIKRKSAILIFKNRNCAFLFQKIYCEEVFYNVNILPTLFQSTATWPLITSTDKPENFFSFYRIPKALFQEPRFQNLSTDAKTLYGILLDRMSLSAKNGWLDEQGRVFIIFTIEDVKRALCCADSKATKLLRELEEFGLIERKRRGLGKPSLVYIMVPLSRPLLKK